MGRFFGPPRLGRSQLRHRKVLCARSLAIRGGIVEEKREDNEATRHYEKATIGKNMIQESHQRSTLDLLSPDG
jgi:hypothetical protein